MLFKTARFEIEFNRHTDCLFAVYLRVGSKDWWLEF